MQKFTIFGPYFNTHNSGTTTLNLFISTSNLFSPHFHKISTIEAHWGTVISPLRKKGTVQYSAKNTVPLDTLLKGKVSKSVVFSTKIWSKKPKYLLI